MTHPKLHLPPQMHAHIYHWLNPYPSVRRVAVTAVTASNFALLLPRRRALRAPENRPNFIRRR